MPTTHAPGPWYATNAGNDHQGLILDEKTGASVAVAYDRCHAHLIVAAPALYEALREAQELIRSLVAEEMIHDTELQRVGNCQANMWSALAQAEGK